MKTLIYLIIFISFFTILFSENMEQNRELIRIKIILGAKSYYEYIQLSNVNYPNSFMIIKRDEN